MLSNKLGQGATQLRLWLIKHVLLDIDNFQLDRCVCLTLIFSTCACEWILHFQACLHMFFSCPATSAFLYCGRDFGDLRRLILSLLAQPGNLLYKQGATPRDIMYVISTSDQAVTVWHVTPISVGGQHLMQWFPPAGKPQWSYVHITSLEEWRMEECEACPPATVKLLNEDGRPRGIMVTIPKQASMPLLKFAANRGFMGMTAVRMLDLA